MLFLHQHRSLLSCIAFLGWILSSSPLKSFEIHAADFGLKADGKSDDGPVIRKMIEAAKLRSPEPVTLVFPEKKTIFASSADNRYLFTLRHTANLTIDGRGSTFLLDPQIRMADLNGAKSIVMKNFQVDHSVSMFIESIVKAVNYKPGYIDVQTIDPKEIDQIGGPTKQDGEQWFGGFVWCENGSYPKAARHFSVASSEKQGNNLIRLFHGEGSFTQEMVKSIIPGVTALSAPRTGVAHRHGPGALFEIHDVTDATFENIHVWAAPWFAFSVYRCEGVCRFHDVDVVAQPGSGRRMSDCRDGIHVTANRARLIFEYCDTRGTGDDDYNFCILSSVIRKVTSPTEMVIRQKFPIQYNPMREGEILMLMDSANSIVGSGKIIRYAETPLKQGNIIPGGSCPEVTIQLDRPINGLKSGLTVWSKEASNPDTIMKHCSASFSIRMQTSLNIQHCRFFCYNTSYGMPEKGDNVEGPGPEFMNISDTEFHIGRGSGYVSQCQGDGPLEKTRLQRIALERCRFHGKLRIDKAQSIDLLNNTFDGEVFIGKRIRLRMEANRRNGHPFPMPE